MSTKPTETGWTTADPKVDGVYWWRADESDNDPDIHFVQGESFYQVGFASSEFTAKFGGEWLGPISPSDFEQLIRLRRIAEQVVIALDATVVDEPKSTNGLAFQQYENFDAQLKSLRDGANALREALVPKGEQS